MWAQLAPIIYIYLVNIKNWNFSLLNWKSSTNAVKMQKAKEKYYRISIL